MNFIWDFHVIVLEDLIQLALLRPEEWLDFLRECQSLLKAHEAYWKQLKSKL